MYQNKHIIQCSCLPPLLPVPHTQTQNSAEEKKEKKPNTIRDTFISLSHLCSFSLIQAFWQACVQLAPTPHHPALQETVPSLFLPSLLAQVRQPSEPRNSRT